MKNSSFDVVIGPSDFETGKTDRDVALYSPAEDASLFTISRFLFDFGDYMTPGRVASSDELGQRWKRSGRRGKCPAIHLFLILQL